MLAVVGPPSLAWVVFMVSKSLAASLMGGDKLSLYDVAWSNDPLLVTAGAVPAAAYALFYFYFLYKHTPRAVAVEVRSKTGSVKLAWQLDRQTAYRPALWNACVCIHFGLACLVFLTLALHSQLSNAMTNIAYNTAYYPMIELGMRLLTSGRVRLNLLASQFIGLPLVLTVQEMSCLWFSGYTVVRWSDYSWGNRVGESDNVHRNQAKTCQGFAIAVRTALICSFLAIFGFIIYAHHVLQLHFKPDNLFVYASTSGMLKPFLSNFDVTMVYVFYGLAAAVIYEISGMKSPIKVFQHL